MNLKRLMITNYRCFKEAEIDFDSHITLVVGKNGAGKTAILDAVAVSVSTFLLGIDGGISRSILKDDMLIENNGSNLSGGEAQRIILARSLCKKSDIYIFDESLSAIDIQSERKIMKNLFSYLNNKTVIVISHRFNNRDLYQQFVCMQKGVVYDY